ncbi:helix-turn-helix domain-containing protein [Streptacidiphilus sp. PAMC 29251]
MTPSSERRGLDPELERLCERLRRTRDYQGMSQQYVSHAIGIPRSAISNIERGLRQVDSLELKKLARLYSLPVSYFLSDQDNTDPAALAGAEIPRALTDLTDGDLKEVLNFAEFLKFRRAHQGKPAGDYLASGGNLSALAT